MRIAYVIWSLGLGGAEQVLMRLAGEMVKRRHEVTVFTLNEAGVFADKMEMLGIPVISLKKRWKVDVGLVWRLQKEMRSRKIEVVHTHLWGANVWGRLAGRLAGVPVVIAHEHGMQPWRKEIHFVLDRIFTHITDLVMFASREVMEGYQKKTGIPPSKCAFITNGIVCDYSPEDREFLRRQMGWKPQDKVVVSVGRLSSEKGHDDLLKAFSVVLRQEPRARLVIVGDGPEKQNLVKLQDRLGLNGAVTLTGMRDDVNRWLTGADLYVQPSRREGLPLAVLEAMAMGLPVVATDVGDLKQVISDGEDGYLVEAGNPDGLAEKMVDLLGRLDQQHSVAEAARRTVQERFSLEQMADQVEDVYKEEISRKRAWYR
ncbi:MAG: glycosyltransferase [Candidatus Omnitrophica bacterium]|nr:glycosyltransferase [Candidatus Omnitrophota bacterium]